MNLPLLSICLPTLNRSEYLCKALKSIFYAKYDQSLVELCISNNASDHNYAAVEQLLDEAPKTLAIRYVVQPARLSLDEHMLAVKKLATSSYIYFLGDDDYFLEGQLPLLLDLIEQETPDLAIFNGYIVDSKNEVIGQHFNLPAHQYSSISTAFTDLRDKGMFGAVLVKAEHLNEENFTRLIGTAHGYGCYWFSLLSVDSSKPVPKILIPKFPLVALRMAAKSYSHLEVYFRDIPYEIAIYQRYLPAGFPQQMNEQFKTRYIKKISSIIFLLHMRLSGVKIMSIREINPEFYYQHRINIVVSEFLAESGAYEMLKRIYRSVIKRRRYSQ